jgi:hypothetical protein
MLFTTQLMVIIVWREIYLLSKLILIIDFNCYNFSDDSPISLGNRSQCTKILTDQSIPQIIEYKNRYIQMKLDALWLMHFFQMLGSWFFMFQLSWTTWATHNTENWRCSKYTFFWLWRRRKWNWVEYSWYWSAISHATGF